MNAHIDEDDILDRLREEFLPDGTHPDFPVRKFSPSENWRRIPWSELAIELPALAVYGAAGEQAQPAIGVVVALCHAVGETRILVRSRHNGRTVCHLIEESPSGLKPSFLLLKRHLPPAGCP